MSPKLLVVSTTYKTRVALENPCKKRQGIVIGQLKDSERLQCRRNADSDGLVRLFRLQWFCSRIPGSDACRKCMAPCALIGTNSGITYGCASSAGINNCLFCADKSQRWRASQL